MALSFTETLVIGISSRALFDLEEENFLFLSQGVIEYRKLQKERETVILNPGTGFHVVKALLNLNSLSTDRLVEGCSIHCSITDWILRDLLLPVVNLCTNTWKHLMFIYFYRRKKKKYKK